MRLALDGDGSAKLDENGKPRGGVRTTFTEVPTARYLSENSGGGVCDRFGGQDPFPPEKLASLYKRDGDYERRVVRFSKKLERDGWLLPIDARAVREEATQVTIP